MRALLLVFVIATWVLAFSTATRLQSNSDSHADGHAEYARAATTAETDADTDADHEWDSFTYQVMGPNPTTDGEMYWLRDMIIRKVNPSDGVARQHGLLLVGQGGLVPRPQQNNIDMDPPAPPPLTHAEFRAFLQLPAAHQRWVEAQSAIFNTFSGHGGIVGAPYPVAAVTDVHLNCDPSIMNAFVSHNPTVGNNDAKGLAQLGLMGGGPGGAGNCALNADLGLVRKWTAVIAAHAAEWTALVVHYARMRTFAGSVAFDVWILRDWLYVTERAHGHRVRGAVGWAADLAGANHQSPERSMLKLPYQSGTRGFGLITDTAGHVRPRALGGQRDPINFVPQSVTGQKFVNAAEELALALKRSCNPAVNVRYGVYFTYANNAGRRPTRARTVVDLEAPCTHPQGRLGPVSPIAAGVLLNWDTATY